MTKPIQVGDLVRITLPEGHAGANQKGVWLVVDTGHVVADYYKIVQGADKHIMLKYDLEKVSE
jgi:hypothetical protein